MGRDLGAAGLIVAGFVANEPGVAGSFAHSAPVVIESRPVDGAPGRSAPGPPRSGAVPRFPLSRGDHDPQPVPPAAGPVLLRVVTLIVLGVAARAPAVATDEWAGATFLDTGGTMG